MMQFFKNQKSSIALIVLMSLFNSIALATDINKQDVEITRKHCKPCGIKNKEKCCALLNKCQQAQKNLPLKPVVCSAKDSNNFCCAPNLLYFGGESVPFELCKNRYNFNTYAANWNIGAYSPFQRLGMARTRLKEFLQRRQVRFEQKITLRLTRFSTVLEALNGETFLPQFGTVAPDEEIWMYDNLQNDQNAYPVRITSIDFNANPQTATMAAISHTQGFPEIYTANTYDFTATIQKVKLDRYFYQVWAGGMNNDGTAILKTRIVNPPAGIPVDENLGIFLRMAYRNTKVGKWIEFTPELVDGSISPIPIATIIANDNMGQWVVKGLKPGCEYAAVIGEVMFGEEWTPYLEGGDTTNKIFTSAKVPEFEAPLFNARFTMPPSSNDCRDIRFGVSSCNAGPINKVFGNAFENDYDFFIWNGDTIYGDNAQPNELLPEPWKPAYEEYWSQLFRSENFMRLFANSGSYGLPEDHDVTNDFWVRGYFINAGGVPNPAFVATPDELNLFLDVVNQIPSKIVYFNLITNPNPLVSADRIVQAYDQMDRFLISRPYTAVQEKRRFFDVSWGKADVIFLDHLPYVNQDTGEITYQQYEGLWFPQNQIEFVKDKLLNSKALVKFVVSASIFSKLLSDEPVPGFPLGLSEKEFVEFALTLGYTEQDARTTYFKSVIASSGDAYPDTLPQVNELMDFILANNIKNVVFISSQSHQSWVRYYDSERCILDVMISASGTNNAGSTNAVESSLPLNNQRVLGVQMQQNYGEFIVSPTKKLLTINIKQDDRILNEFVIKLK